MRSNPIKKYAVLFFALILMFFSCKKNDKIDTNSDLKLWFSADTVYFDTVFATVGSVTRRLVVHNGNDGKVVVSSIQLAGGSASMYKLNIDGISADLVKDIEIAGKDSLYIFVRVTVDPNNQNNPFAVTDSILFLTNGNPQKVQLLAWGQNAFFYRNDVIKGNLVWDSLRAHVIYGSLRVDTGSTLTIMPGTKVYFHLKSHLAVSYGASMIVAGNLDHPVRFQGDRLDPFYRDLPGQWDGIFLESGSKENQFNYAILKNGSIGLYVDSIGNSVQPTLRIDNTIIQNMSADGLLAFGTFIESTNCLINNCGGAAIDIISGGSYDFRQLTMGNYWNRSVRTTPSLYLSNYTYDTLGNKVPHPLTKAYFGNCILTGSETEEIGLDPDPSVPFEFTFDHCLLRTLKNTTDPLHYLECMVNKDPGFVDVLNYNFEIDSISPAIDQGIPMGVPFDIKGIERGITPDLGVFEYFKHP